MSEEEESKLDYLGKQYKRLLINLKNNENVIQFRKKLGILFFIGFVYSFISIIVFTYIKINNILLQNILGAGFVGINLYVYIFFYNFYINDAERKSAEILEEIDNITKEIDFILLNNNINNNEFYDKLEIDINN